MYQILDPMVELVAYSESRCPSFGCQLAMSIGVNEEGLTEFVQSSLLGGRTIIVVMAWGVVFGITVWISSLQLQDRFRSFRTGATRAPFTCN